MSVYQYRIDHVSPELITLSEAKKQLRIEDDFREDDGLIQNYIAAAISVAENYTNTHISQVKIEYRASSFADLCNSQPFKLCPVSAIESIVYKDKTGLVITIDDSNYELLPIDGYTQKLQFNSDYQFPETESSKSGVIKAVVVVGYDELKSAEKSLKQALMLIMTSFYENRMDRVEKFPNKSEVLLQKYKNYR